MSKLREVKQILYTLKRDWGQTILVYVSNSPSIDTKTGEVTTDNQEYTIKHAIVLPVKSVRAFSYDLSYIAANKNFTYGGFFDTGLRAIIVDKKDLGNYIPDLNDQAVIEGARYEYKAIEQLTGSYGYIIFMQMITTATIPVINPSSSGSVS